jgi:predicted ABC-type ATPase
LKPRPVLFVLAGVNGAGKSSVGGHLLERAGLAWFNPDTFARELRAGIGCNQVHANAAAWQEGMRRLDEAVLQVGPISRSKPPWAAARSPRRSGSPRRPMTF